MDVKRIFARNMRIYRIREGLSQEALAEKCGLHRTYIGAIEQKSCNVTLETVEKIAVALQVSPIELLKDTTSINNESSDMELAFFRESDKAGKNHYALCSWNDGEDPEFMPIQVQNEDLTLRILCMLIQEGYTENLAEAYDKVQEPILRYLQTLKRSEYPQDYLAEIWKERMGKTSSGESHKDA